ncbi:hypothetical protein GCM10010276_79460 [Streptomyces longisporus]|uniref:Uncharacterized protein n=1 Tax=Streptomyces longisporus TaxID=1948 RepID=A0ABN3NBD0_STRLO
MRKRQITRGSELVTYVTFPTKRDSSVESQRTPGDTQGGFGHAPIKKVGEPPERFGVAGRIDTWPYCCDS